MSHNFVGGNGPENASVMLIGESPGKTEDEEGIPFCGVSGRELDRFYLPQAYLRRREVYVTNLVKCHPYGNRNPVKAEIEFFEHFLLEEIEKTKPKVIAALGAFSTKYFIGNHRDLHQVHGLPFESKRFPGVTILPCYHPASGLYSSDSQPLIISDFQQIRHAIDGTLSPRPRDTFPDPAYFELFTSPEVLTSLEGSKAFLLGLDTEGYKGCSWGLSYSIAEGVAYVIRAGAKDALRAFGEWISRHPECRVILHNALHDLPILREMGITITNFEDTMVYAYCLCLEPQGLKDLAYRHVGMKMKSYSDVVEPAMRKLTTDYLIKVSQGDWGLDPVVPERESDQEIKYRQPTALHKRALRAVNDILGRYVGTIIGPKRGGSTRLDEVGVCVGKVDHETVAKLGLKTEITIVGKKTTRKKTVQELNAWFCEVPIPLMPKLESLYGDFIWELKDPVVPEEPPDAIKRWTAMSEDLEESVERCEQVLGTLPVVGLDALEDQEVAVNYSARDSHATIAIRNSLYSKIEANGLVKLADLDMSVLPYLDRMQSAGIKVNREHMLRYGAELKIEMRQLQEKLHNDLGIWINPSSSKQVALLIYDILGFPVEFRTKGGDPSTNDKVLEALAPQHQNITDVTDYRELHKLRSTYCLSLPEWTDEFERVHATWKYTRVASGRLSTADPNLLGIPTRSDRGREIRRGFVPEPGHVFISCDLSQIEMRVAAHYSQDPSLTKIFQEAKSDMHTMVAAAMWKLSEKEIADDDKLNGGASMRSSGKNCVHPDTIVWTDRSPRTIRDIGFGSTSGEFTRVTAPLTAFNGLQYSDVTHTFNGGIKGLYHVVTNRAVLTCTADHEIETCNGLMRVADIKEKERLPEPLLPHLSASYDYKPVPVKINRYVPITYVLPTHDHAYFAGAFAGDGCSISAKTGNVSFAHGPISQLDDYGNLYRDWRDVLVDACNRIGVVPVGLGERYIDLGRRNFHGFMRGLQLLSEQRKLLRIPQWVLSAGRESILHFMGGLFDTDGTVGAKSPAIEMCTKDAVFAGQIAAVLTGLGFLIGVAPAYNKTYNRWYYEIRINTSTAFLMKPYMRHAGKVNRLRPQKLRSDGTSYNAKHVQHSVTKIFPCGDSQCVDISVNSLDHLYTANALRTHNCSFGILYGIGAKGLQAQLKSKCHTDWSEDACQDMIDKWLDAYPQVRWYMERMRHACRTKGYVETMYGRRRYLPGANSTVPRIREEAYRAAINHPIQGTASEILKIAEANIWKKVFPKYWNQGFYVEPVAAIHDELLLEADKDIAEEVRDMVIFEMENAVQLCVPIVSKGKISKDGADGGSWADLK